MRNVRAGIARQNNVRAGIARQTKLFVALAIAPLLALTACGGSNQAAGFTSPGGILAAVNTTKAEQTSKVDLVMTMSGIPGMPGDVTINGTGAFNYETGNGQLTMQVPAIAAPGTEASVETRVVDDVVYVKTTTPDGQSVTPQPWIKVDVEAAAQASGLGGGALNEASSNPTEGLEMLANAAAGEITEVGTETLRGDETTHYRMDIDLTQTVEGADEATAQQMQRLAELYGNNTIPADVWVDDNDRVRKVSLTIDLANITVPGSTPGTQPSGTMSIATEFYDFGTDVNVEAPPADQVMDVTGAATEAATPPAEVPAA